jgi:hypothetical protein
MTYTQTAVKAAECYFCGFRRPCTRLTADQGETETGYRDEIEVCGECLESTEVRKRIKLENALALPYLILVAFGISCACFALGVLVRLFL